MRSASTRSVFARCRQRRSLRGGWCLASVLPAPSASTSRARHPLMPRERRCSTSDRRAPVWLHGWRSRRPKGSRLDAVRDDGRNRALSAAFRLGAAWSTPRSPSHPAGRRLRNSSGRRASTVPASGDTFRISCTAARRASGTRVELPADVVNMIARLRALLHGQPVVLAPLKLRLQVALRCSSPGITQQLRESSPAADRPSGGCILPR